ncbi:MAG: hypothetical protein K2X71_08130 [Methylobacterium sp.]|uniref:hypothetical protein n=1 Tax=Methylobacterium sp. TaxID=409 RepID=UPI0025893690|nr:hypothetical protein [Methylobacterium sp.]MBY0295990.1 hypothetical protein [Methylobacterium sp.]
MIGRVLVAASVVAAAFASECRAQDRPQEDPLCALIRSTARDASLPTRSSGEIVTRESLERAAESDARRLRELGCETPPRS